MQQVLEENRDLANEVASAFEAATAAINEYQKAALGGDNPSGEGNRDDGSGKGSPSGSAESSRDTGGPYNPEVSARNLENGEYRSEGYKGEIQGLPMIREVIDTPAATQPLATAAGKEPDPDIGASGLLSKLGDLLSTSLHETVAPVVQNTSRNVSAPVTIQVRSTGANAEQVGQKLYDTAERYLLRTLRGVMA